MMTDEKRREQAQLMTALETIRARHGSVVASAIHRVAIMLRKHNSNCLDEDADVLIAALSQPVGGEAVLWQWRRKGGDWQTHYHPVVATTEDSEVRALGLIGQSIDLSELARIESEIQEFLDAADDSVEDVFDRLHGWLERITALRGKP